MGGVFSVMEFRIALPTLGFVPSTSDIIDEWCITCVFLSKQENGSIPLLIIECNVVSVSQRKDAGSGLSARSDSS